MTRGQDNALELKLQAEKNGANGLYYSQKLSVVFPRSRKTKHIDQSFQLASCGINIQTAKTSCVFYHAGWRQTTGLGMPCRKHFDFIQ